MRNTKRWQERPRLPRLGAAFITSVRPTLGLMQWSTIKSDQKEADTPGKTLLCPTVLWAVRMNTCMCGCCCGHPQHGNCPSNLCAFGHYNTSDFGRDPRQRVSEAAGLAPWDHTWSPSRRMEVAHVPGPQHQHGLPSLWTMVFHLNIVCGMSALPSPGSLWLCECKTLLLKPRIISIFI